MKDKSNSKKPYSNIQYVLWLIAGSEIATLKKCPADYNRHANIGLMIFITSLFAGLTSLIAGHTFAPDSYLGIGLFALVWAFLIFSLDRSMVNSIKKDPKDPDKSMMSYFWPRLILAIILSFFMSIPLDHIVFEDKIKYQMDQNNTNDWHKRQLQLHQGLGIDADSAKNDKLSKQSEKLEEEINKGCALCTLEEYITPNNEADRIVKYELPPLIQKRTAAQAAYNEYFQKLRRAQTPSEEPLIAQSEVRSDKKLRSLNQLRGAANANLISKNAQVSSLRQKANQICEKWKADNQKKKIVVDSTKKIVETRLSSNEDSLRIKSQAHLNMITAMQGFDTKFVTLFLMPDWGVQFLKWLIFLALLVIEILPTYLKLKTPVGQYDWEMYYQEKDTEEEVKARIDALTNKLKNIEEYRTSKEVDLNKKMIDKVVDIEEKLANEMLEEWESKAREEMMENVSKS